MGYHDRMPPSYKETGIAVVNPLRQLQKRLDKIQEVIDGLPEKAVTVAELSDTIQKILNGEQHE